MGDRRIFHERVFDRLRQAAREAAADAPELEVVAFVCVWRGMKDQRDVPSAMVVGADGPPVSPAILLRLQASINHLQQYVCDRVARATVALTQMAEVIAGKVNEQRPRTAAPQGDRAEESPAPADGAPT
jgi:hypothetical protein